VFTDRNQRRWFSRYTCYTCVAQHDKSTYGRIWSQGSSLVPSSVCGCVAGSRARMRQAQHTTCAGYFKQEDVYVLQLCKHSFTPRCVAHGSSSMGAGRWPHAFAAVACLLAMMLAGHDAQTDDVAAAAPGVTTAVGTAAQAQAPAFSTISVCSRLLVEGDRRACEAYYKSLSGTGRAGVLYASLSWDTDYPASCKQLQQGGKREYGSLKLQIWQSRPANIGRMHAGHSCTDSPCQQQHRTSSSSRA
jgi:hypothetical protein